MSYVGGDFIDKRCIFIDVDTNCTDTRGWNVSLQDLGVERITLRAFTECLGIFYDTGFNRKIVCSNCIQCFYKLYVGVRYGEP